MLNVGTQILNNTYTEALITSASTSASKLEPAYILQVPAVQNWKLVLVMRKLPPTHKNFGSMMHQRKV